MVGTRLSIGDRPVHGVRGVRGDRLPALGIHIRIKSDRYWSRSLAAAPGKGSFTGSTPPMARRMLRALSKSRVMMVSVLHWVGSVDWG